MRKPALCIACLLKWCNSKFTSPMEWISLKSLDLTLSLQKIQEREEQIKTYQEEMILTTTEGRILPKPMSCVYTCMRARTHTYTHTHFWNKWLVSVDCKKLWKFSVLCVVFQVLAVFTHCCYKTLPFVLGSYNFFSPRYNILL